MAVIYLTHPVHGAKVACSDMEADFDQHHGWTRYNPDAEEAPVDPVVRRGRRKKAEEVADEGE